MNGSRMMLRGSLLLALLAAGAWSGPARAGTDVDFGASIRVGDDSELFLAISSHYFGRDQDVVRQWEGRYHDPDDCAVALFLADRCRQDPEVIFRLRHDGVSWWDIGLRFGLPMDAWFVPVTFNPGPPYGRAYGFWRRYRHDHHYRFRLSDREACDLVALRMAHEYYGVGPASAMKWRATHRDVRSLLSSEYRRRHPLQHLKEPPPRSRRGGRGDRSGGYDRADDHGRQGRGRPHGKGGG